MAIKDDWHLDKKVNVSIIIMLCLQLMGGAWMAGEFAERVTQLERRLEGFADRSAITDREVIQQGEEIATLAAEIKSLTRQLERLYAQGAATNDLLRQVIRESVPPRGRPVQ